MDVVIVNNITGLVALDLNRPVAKVSSGVRAAPCLVLSGKIVGIDWCACRRVSEGFDWWSGSNRVHPFFAV